MDELKRHIYNLIQLNDELGPLSERISRIKEEKLQTEQLIKVIMTEEHLKDKVFIINNKKVKYNETKSYQSYSLHYLEQKLNEIVKDDQSVSYILKYLKDNRKSNINSVIKILDYNNE